MTIPIFTMGQLRLQDSRDHVQENSGLKEGEEPEGGEGSYLLCIFVLG